uniref:Uncharacterized protein n=1 Tax=Strigamia maritima TaxID=126957 RepID=T1JFJ5_STRMM
MRVEQSQKRRRRSCHILQLETAITLRFAVQSRYFVLVSQFAIVKTAFHYNGLKQRHLTFHKQLTTVLTIQSELLSEASTSTD